MLPGAKIMLFEMMAEVGNVEAALMDINILALSLGKVRTLDQYKALFEISDLCFVKIIRLACPLVCFEISAI